MVSREKRIVRVEIILTIALFILILIRVVWIIVSTDDAQIKYNDPIVASQVVRGTIYDAQSNILAIETPYYSLALHLQKAEDITKTIETIAPVVNMSTREIEDIVSQRSTYALIKRRLNFDQKERLEQLSSSDEKLGIVIEKRYGRTYPQVHHAAQVIGFTNTENKGLEGLELTQDRILSPYPEPGRKITYGNDIYLTIDMTLQYLLDQSILSIEKEHDPDSIAGIIMESRTGAIRAVSNYPWYDPNSYWESPAEYRTNAFSTLMREPGSVFKIFSLACELDSSTIESDEHFFCDGSYTYTDEDGNEITINCVEPHGDVTPVDMIAKSCNGAVAHWSHEMPDEVFRQYLEAFGFTERYDIGLPGTTAGYLAPVSLWSSRSKETISFGQEIAVSPLQIAAAATAIANGGMKVEPYLIEKVCDHDNTIVKQHSVRYSGPIISKQTADIVLEGMEMASQPGGTAVKIGVEGVRIGAKTGTAQVADEQTGSYSDDTYLASTLSIFPLDDPKYIIYIGALNPKGSTIWGSSIASPGISQIISDMVRLGYIKSSAIEDLQVTGK